MATLTIHVQIAADAEPRAIAIDPDQFTLGMLEDLEKAQETGKWRDIAPVIAEMLGLTREEQRAITIGQWKNIGQSMREAAEAPNVSG